MVYAGVILSVSIFRLPVCRGFKKTTYAYVVYEKSFCLVCFGSSIRKYLRMDPGFFYYALLEQTQNVDPIDVKSARMVT